MSDERQKIVENHVTQLMEHFETVQIFCTRQNTEQGSTESYQTGDGNWYARYGQIREWMDKQEEAARVDERKHTEDDE